MSQPALWMCQCRRKSSIYCGELQRRYQLAYVFISQHLRVVRALANHLLVMKNGRVAGPARQVLPPIRSILHPGLLAAALNLETFQSLSTEDTENAEKD